MHNIQQHAIHRYREGLKEWGEIDPKTDKRDMVQEALEELADARNYIKWTKLPLFNKNAIQRILELTYIMICESNEIIEMDTKDNANNSRTTRNKGTTKE